MNNSKILISGCFLSLIAMTFLYLIYSDSMLIFHKQQSIEKSPIISMIQAMHHTKTSETINILSQLIDKPNEVVFRYVNLPLDYKYGSNSIPLTVAALFTAGDILELGMGLFSTPLLHNICADQNRTLTSVDTNLDWLEKFIIYNSTNTHRIYHLGTYEINKFGLDKQWGLVLVDHIDAGSRSLNVIKFSEIAQIVIVHDTEKSQETFYGYEKNKIRSFFKYSCKYSIYSDATRASYISTLILSNFVSLNKMKSIFNRITTDFGHVACDINYR